jgi:hypothetical protein
MCSNWRPLTCAIITTSLAMLLTACGLTVNKAGAWASDTTTPISIDLSGPTTVTLGGQSQYSATVTGSSDNSVTWSVNGVAGGNATVGSITSTGLYLAPVNAPQSSQVTITATSVASPTASQSLGVALATQPKTPTGTSAVTLLLNGPTSVTLGTTSQYAATVTGTSNTAVTWSVNGAAGGSATAGFISPTGLYTAPASASPSSTAMITATSVADPYASESIPVTLVAPPQPPVDGGSDVTLSLSGPTKVTLGTSANFAATVTGSSDTAVTWSINGVVGGNTTLGYISQKGTYTAPATQPKLPEVTITATSMADPSVWQSLAVTLATPANTSGGGPAVTLTLSGATSVTLGASSKYAATVTGSSDSAVTWSVNGVVGGDRILGSISTSGLYTAPATAPQPSKVTITATSNADPSVAQSLTVVLSAPKAAPVTLALSGLTSLTLGTSSQYAATVKGSTNTAVIWSVDGVVGGNSAYGAISAIGRYTAPAKAPQSSKVTIAATSSADPTVTQSLVVTLTAPPTPPGGGPVTITLAGATSVNLGSSSQYAATVSGSSNTSVTWQVNGVTGGNAIDGTISAKGLYIAPSTAPQPSTVTITAASVADPSVAKSLVTTLVSPAPSDRIPANAISSGPLDGSTKWQWNHDPGTPGSSQGSSVYPISGLAADNVAREFYMTYSAHGGEIYHVSFAIDKIATHFIYDAYVYVVDPSQLANLEMDMNDVMADGRTVILATQCSTYSKSWEYTLMSNNAFHWHPSNIHCDPKTWSAKTWHHIQIASHRDANGNATYDWIGFDGVYTDFQNATGSDARPLGWAVGDLLINFQIDGANSGSGSNTLYTDKLTVYRW